MVTESLAIEGEIERMWLVTIYGWSTYATFSRYFIRVHAPIDDHMKWRYKPLHVQSGWPDKLAVHAFPINYLFF